MKMSKLRGRTRLSEKQMKVIIELSQKPVSRKEIAKEAEVNPATVYRYQKRFDLL